MVLHRIGSIQDCRAQLHITSYEVSRRRLSSEQARLKKRKGNKSRYYLWAVARQHVQRALRRTNSYDSCILADPSCQPLNCAGHHNLYKFALRGLQWADTAGPLSPSYGRRQLTCNVLLRSKNRCYHFHQRKVFLPKRQRWTAEGTVPISSGVLLLLCAMRCVVSHFVMKDLSRGAHPSALALRSISSPYCRSGSCRRV